MMEMTWQQVETRLQRVEVQMKTVHKLLEQTADSEIEYAILVDNEEVWVGSNVDEQIPVILKQYPHKQIRIDWRSAPYSWV